MWVSVDTGVTTSANSLLAIAGSFIAINTITVLLRFAARRSQAAPLLADDWSMLAALISFLIYAACTIVLVKTGCIGWGSFPFPIDELPSRWLFYAKYTVMSDVALNLCEGLVKVSALLLYRRVFCLSGSFNRSLNWIIIGTIVIIACWVITFSFLAGFQCGGSFQGDWDPATNARNCSIGNVYAYGIFLSDLLLDLWVILLPIPKILGLRMAPMKKFLTICIFSIAFVGFAVSIVRFVDFLQVAVLHTKIPRVEQEEDFNSRLFFFNTLELGMMTVSINMPVLWGLFYGLAPELMIKMARSVTSLASRHSSRRADSEGTGSSDPKATELSNLSRVRVDKRTEETIPSLPDDHV